MATQLKFILPDESENLSKPIKINLSLPEMYIATRAINKLCKTYAHKQFLPIVIEPIDIAKAFDIPGVTIDYVPTELVYQITKTLHSLENSNNNGSYDKNLKNSINKIFISIKCDDPENRFKILNIVYDTIYPFKLHYPQCNPILLPFVLEMIREWIYCINYQFPDFIIKGNDAEKINTIKYDFINKSSAIAKECIFQNHPCLNCYEGKLNVCNWGCTDLECNNVNCKWIYEIKSNYNDNKEIFAGNEKGVDEFLINEKATLIVVTKNKIKLYSSKTLQKKI
jgi:hypothetical protein